MRACCRRRASTASTAHRIELALHKKADTRRSERDNASKRTELARAKRVVENLHSSLCSQNEPRSRTLPGLPRSSTTQQLSWCATDWPLFPISQIRSNMVKHCSFSPSVLCQFVHACGVGLFSWGMELLTFARHQFAPKITDLSVRFTLVRIFFCSSSWASVAAGRPPAERSALNVHTYVSGLAFNEMSKKEMTLKPCTTLYVVSSCCCSHIN